MRSPEALQAVLNEGGVVVIGDVYYKLGNNGNVVCSSGQKNWQDSLVSLSDVTAMFRTAIYANPHPRGSYLWAKFEFESNCKVVGRGHWFDGITPGKYWPSNGFSNEDFNARDWIILK